MLFFHVVPHAFGLSFYVEAVSDMAHERQPQMVVDVIVYGHVIADQVYVVHLHGRLCCHGDLHLLTSSD